MYGFNKIMHLQQGVLKSDPSDHAEILEFRNEHFQREQPDLLCLIQRKKSQAPGQQHGEERALTAASSSGDTKNQALALDLRTILNDISSIRKHQSSISQEMKDLMASNKQLWNEAIASRERHQRHQDTINKIVRFLGAVYGGSIVETPQAQPESAGSTPDSNAEAGPSTSKTASEATAQTHQAPPVKPPNRKMLLLKDRDDRPGGSGGQIEELIDLPDEEDFEPLPDISRPQESSTSSHGSLSMSRSGPPSTSLPPASSILPSPLSSPSQLVPFTSSTPTGPSLSAFQDNGSDSLMPFLQQAQSSFTPPAAFSGPDVSRDERLKKVQKEYDALTAQMSHVQGALTRLSAQLPNDYLDSVGQGQQQSTDGADASNSSTTLDYDMLENFLQQYGNSDGSEQQQMLDQQQLNDLDWFLNPSQAPPMFGLDSGSKGHEAGTLASRTGVPDLYFDGAEQGSLNTEGSASIPYRDQLQPTSWPQFDQASPEPAGNGTSTPPQIEEIAASPPGSAKSGGRGRKRSAAASTRTSTRKRGKV